MNREPIENNIQEFHVTIVGVFRQLTIVTKSSKLDAAVFLGLPLIKVNDSSRT